MELCAEFIFPYEDGAPVPSGIRVTVGEASLRDLHRYRRMVAEAWAWFWAATAQHQAQPGEQKLEAVPDDDPAWQMLAAGQERAYMLATLRKVEYPVVDGWQAGELPATWAGLEGFANGCPALLAAAWAEAARRCNPGLFEAEPGDPKARRGGARVTKPAAG